MSKNKNATFVNFGGIDYWYHNRAHAEVQLMTRIARTHKVLFINSIGMRTPTRGSTPNPGKRILRKIKSTAKYLRKPIDELPNFYVFSPVILPFYESETLRKLNAWFIAIQVRIVSRIIGSKHRTISVTVPTAAPAISKIPHEKLVLHRFDKMSAFKGGNKELLESYEHELLKLADIVLFSSTTLMDEESHQCNGSVFFFDHGVDLEQFKRNNEIPNDMNNIPKPIIGFFGGLDDHVVDFELLNKIATDIPDASLVLVGDAPRPMDELTKHTNVYWLGKKQLSEIPSYGSNFDVAIMPFQDSQWLKYANPIKLKEYLALGLPIVSTVIPEIARYSTEIKISADHDLFIKNVQEIIANLDHYSSEEFQDKLRQVVAGDDWDARADQYLIYVN